MTFSVIFPWKSCRLRLGFPIYATHVSDFPDRKSRSPDVQDREPRCASVSVVQLLLLVEKRHENWFKILLKKRALCRDIHIWYHIATPPSKTHRAEDSDAYWCVKFRCFIHLEAYIAHIQLWPVSFKNTTYTQGFYFIVMLFFVLLHEFQSNGSLPCEGGFSHTCTNIFFKEYHKHCLKWVLKGFLSQGILRPLFSRHVLLYSMKFCKKWCYASTLLSEYRVLHPF